MSIPNKSGSGSATSIAAASSDERVTTNEYSASIPGEDSPSPGQEDGGPSHLPTVLLVDDEPVVQEVAAEMLESLGFEVCCADDGPEAVEFFRRHAANVDVVLLDLTMPKMGGRECLRKLLEIDPDANVVFTSGIHVESERETLLHEGAKEVIQKPFLLGELARKLGKVVETRPD